MTRDPLHGSDSTSRDSPVRRRSSIAYDPARDAFTEIPGNISVSSAAIDEELPLSQFPPPSRKPSKLHAGQDLVMDDGSRKRARPEDGEHTAADGTSQEHTPKKARSSPDTTSIQTGNGNPDVKSVKDLPRVPKKVREEGEARDSRRPPSAYSRRPESDRPREYQRPAHRRSRSPEARRRSPGPYRRRSPPRRRDPSRSPSPIRSPPRDGPVVRPGGAKGRGRNVLAEQQRLQAEREQRQSHPQPAPHRGVQDVSNQFYNQRPEWVKEKGRDWRRNESQIRGLRSFNNWIKSCLIHKFSPEEKSVGEEEELGWGEQPKEPEAKKPLLILDVGCGKGGDLGKWQLAPQQVGLYVGLDPAAMSVRQAQDRYSQMRRGRRPIFDANFVVKDCFGEWLGDVPIVRKVGIDPSAGTGQPSRFGGGGFDIVTMMFTMHYSFESEDKVKMMLRNVAGSLKKGGRLFGVSPNSDVLAEGIRRWYREHPDKTPTLVEGKDAAAAAPPQQSPSSSAAGIPASAIETPPTQEEGEAEDDSPHWGNKIYRVRFPLTNTHGHLASDGTFRPPTGWKYTYWMAEAVDVPEFVVPWEAFRAIAAEYGLEQRYRKGFLDIWESETKGSDPVSRELASLGVRMGVTRREGGELVMSEEEKEAVSFYHAFCFVKV